MPTHKWTVEQARLAGKRSAQLRAERKLNPPPEPEPAPTVVLEMGLPTQNPQADKFTRALDKTLDKFLACEDAREMASIARSMREVRETYHLWSGQPKPGTIKPERQSSRQQVRQPSEPKLDTTTGSVPTDPTTPQ